MKNYIYFSFILYIGLLCCEFIIKYIPIIFNTGDIEIGLDLFINPIKLSLIGGFILLLTNKIPRNKNDK